MACTTQALSAAAASCEPAIAGNRICYVCKYSEITGFTVATNAITAITMSTTGLWKAWTFTKDSTAYYNAIGQDQTKNAFQFDQEAFIKYSGTSLAAVKAANAMIKCCDLVLLSFLENGIPFFQGVEFNAAGTGVIQSKEPARYVPSIYSGAGDEESRVEFRIKSKAQNQAVGDPATITETYITGL